MTEPGVSQPTRQPLVKLLWRGVDVSAPLAPMTLDFTYTDQAHGQSDEIRLKVENADLRWLHDWYPHQGDVVEAWVGYVNGLQLPCGQFTIDAPEFSGAPDVVDIRGQAAAVTTDLRTPRDRAYEQTTLGGIAREIAARHGLQLVGDLPGVPVARITQPGESDLAFLTRLADLYGYAFSARGGTLTFHSWAGLEGASSGLTLTPGQSGEGYYS